MIVITRLGFELRLKRRYPFIIMQVVEPVA